MRSSAEAIGETDLPDLCLNGSDRWDLPNRSLSRPGSRSFMPSGDVRCMPGSLALQAPFEGQAPDRHAPASDSVDAIDPHMH